MSLTSLKSFYSPTNTQELAPLLESYGDRSLIVAGGSFIHGLAARGLIFGVEALIDIRSLGLNRIDNSKSGLAVGATVRMKELLANEQVANTRGYQAIKQALSYPPVQVRNVATIGGNVATACSFFDLPTALLALDAEVAIDGPNGKRFMGIRDFMLGPFENAMQENEFLTAINIPPVSNNASSAFLKLETNANDLAIVNAATAVCIDEDGKYRNVRVALGGGLAGTIVRSSAAEKLLEGQTPSEELHRQASESVVADIDPMSDHRASAAYRTAIAKVFTLRVIENALAQARNGEVTL